MPAMEYHDFAHALIKSRESLARAQAELRCARLHSKPFTIKVWEEEVGHRLDSLWAAQIACCADLLDALGLDNLIRHKHGRPT